MTLAFFIKTEILTFDFNFNCLFAVVSVGKTVVRIDVAVCVGSVGVCEGGVMVGGIAIVTSPDSRVVHPGIGLRVSLGIGLSNGFSLSLHKWHILGISRAFAIVSIGKTIVRIDVAVGVGSIGVCEGGVMVGGIAIVTTPNSRVVHPGIGLRVSLGIGLSNGFSLSLHKWHTFSYLGISRAFAVVSIGKTIVRIDVAVCVGSVGVCEGGVMVGGIAIVTSPNSRVVDPGISLRVSLSAGLSNRLGLSLLHSDGRFLLNSSGGGGGHNSGGYETSMGAGDKSYTF